MDVKIQDLTLFPIQTSAEGNLKACFLSSKGDISFR